jgi:hypothetical protein
MAKFPLIKLLKMKTLLHFRCNAFGERTYFGSSEKEVDLIFDLESEEYKNLWGFAQEVAKKIKTAIPCVRVGVAVVGLKYLMLIFILSL